jgi:hypothetical protein
MKGLRKKQVKGGTIVEVLIALAIMSFCASLAVIIYLNIQKSSLPFFKLKAVELSEFYMKEAFDKETFSDETFKAEEFTIKKSVTTHGLFSDCYLVRIIVFDNSKKKLHELEAATYTARE